MFYSTTCYKMYNVLLTVGYGGSWLPAVWGDGRGPLWHAELWHKLRSCGPLLYTKHQTGHVWRHYQENRGVRLGQPWLVPSSNHRVEIYILCCCCCGGVFGRVYSMYILYVGSVLKTFTLVFWFLCSLCTVWLMKRVLQQWTLKDMDSHNSGKYK